MFSWKRDAVASHKMYTAWADRAWNEFGCDDARGGDSNYEWGFREGFVDYCFAGGTGEPPAIPPRPFWNAGWRTGPGKQAADQWFAGFRDGAQVARDGGYRDEAMIRSSVAWASYVEPIDEWVVPDDSAGFEQFMDDESVLRHERIEPGIPVLPAPAESLDLNIPTPGVDEQELNNGEPEDELPDDEVPSTEDFSLTDENQISLVAAASSVQHESFAEEATAREIVDTDGHVWRRPKSFRRHIADDTPQSRRRGFKQSNRR